MYTRQWFALFILTIFLTASVFAQEHREFDSTLVLSSNPTVIDLTRLFSETTAGQHDPFVVLPKIASLGNNVVPALRSFIFSTPVLKIALLDSIGNVIDSIYAPTPNRIYGVMSLDLIGTQNAYQVLSDVAQSDTNSEVRGAALKTLALNCHHRTDQESLAPDKEVVHLLLKNMDDTTYITGSAMKMGEIAREGLKNWIGTDYGEILPDSLRTKDEETLGVPLPQHREKWWQQNSGKMKWNKSGGHFEFTKENEK